MEVATATLEFAEGRYSKRVHTDSQTEIGKLYEAFNEMADKLQERDELLRTFNEQLENKVRERTIELEKAHEKLRRTEKIAAVGQIAAGVTHEVRHPLNSLALSAHELSKEISGKLGDDSPAYKSSRLFNFEINRINSILEEFINFAKFPEPRFFDNDINKVIREVVDMFGSLKEKGVSIELLLDESIPSFKFDARQVKEIFINLLENACKATGNGGRVEIKTAIADHNVNIKVRDTGRGISDNVLEKIFSPFFSTDDAGLGLGLPIVQKIVESHGGKIKCNSKVGKGTEFEITLPTEAAVGVLL
jgi:signal transduction histidine kinase